MCKRNREIRSGWIKVCSASFITKHTLLEMKNKHWVHNLLFTRLVELFTQGSSCSHRKGFFHGFFRRFLTIFTERRNVQSKRMIGGTGLEGQGLWGSRWLLQQHRVSESTADQSQSRRGCGCCRQPCACVGRLGQPGPPCPCHEPWWSAALGSTAGHFQGHWIPVCTSHPGAVLCLEANR